MILMILNNARNYLSWLLACSSSCWLLAAPSFALAPSFWLSYGKPDRRVKDSCAEQSLATLITDLMIDLPNYANRIIQRSRHLNDNIDIFPYILVAGNPEFKPLPLNSFAPHPEYESPGVKQVFFTTLERQYLNHRAIELQQFHWLFLTKAKTGWQFVIMFSQIGKYPIEESAKKNNTSIILQRRESSDSAIGVGVKNWLRDCDSK